MFKRVTEISFNQYIALSFFSWFWKIQAWASFFIDISGMFSPMCLDYWVCPQRKVDKGDDPFSTKWKRLWTPPLNYVPVFFPLLSSPIPHPPHLIFTILPLIFSRTYFSLHSITILASTLLSSSRVQDYKAWGPSCAILQGNGPASLPLQWKHCLPRASSRVLSCLLFKDDSKYHSYWQCETPMHGTLTLILPYFFIYYSKCLLPFPIVFFWRLSPRTLDSLHSGLWVSPELWVNHSEHNRK